MSAPYSTPLDFVLLIPCYNNQEGLLLSLKSIFYPKSKFEVLIIDDGSTVPVDKQTILQRIPEMIIQVIRLEQNKGIVNALNTGLHILKSRTDFKYIARLDAGDVCSEQRFYKEVSFLNEHPDIGLLASWARFRNSASGAGYDYVTKTTHIDIIKEMHYKCSFIHPSVMFRKDILDKVGVYPENFPHAEDYAFFWKILKSYKGAVLPEKLITISFSDESISAVNYKKQLKSRKLIVNNFGNYFWHKLMGNLLLTLKSILHVSIIRKLKNILSHVNNLTR